jgi:excisionase family DNA binding protein
VTLRAATLDAPMVRASARVSRVAELLDCDESDVRRLIDRGELEAHGLGKRGVRVYLDSVIDYQAGRARKPKRAVDKPRQHRSATHAAHLAAEAELRKAGIIP